VSAFTIGPVEVRVLGPVEVVDGDGVVVIGPKERRLLARLVAGRGRSVPDDVLVDVVWGDRPPVTARKTLQGHVHHLRRAIGNDAVLRTDGGYRLGPTIPIDIDDVERMLATARQAAADGRRDESAELFERAGRRFRGAAFGELEDDPSTVGLRGQLAELELTVAEERLVNELDRGNHRRVIGELESLVGRDPTRERAWCLLVTALAGCGRQSDALHAVARAKRSLALELGIEPGPQLRELERAVLNQQASAIVSSAETVAPSNVRAARHPPSPSSVSRTDRLPTWDTCFCGRSNEHAWLLDRVPTARVVVLTGPGGIGKTRLAASVASQLAGKFADGVYFVELAGIVDDAADYVIAESVGVRREPDRSPLDSLIAWLGDRHVLVVLDNCEEIVDTVRRSVEVLVSCCPNLHIVVTSRGPLGVRGELRVPLPPLDRPAAVELLVDRLITSTRDFEPDGDAGALDTLCQQLDGVPLALELAAAQCRTMTPAELLVRLARRPDVLADRTGLFDERHRDLDRLICWSRDQLSPKSQRVASRLTVVIGSFTLDAAEAIATGGDLDEIDVVGALEELEDAGLIIREHVQGELRHRLLEPIRQHVANDLDESEHIAAARRHAHWFSDLANAVKAGSTGRHFGRWADLVDRDLANFRQAHRLLVDHGDPEHAVAIVDGLATIGAERCVMELADWCDATVKLVEGRGDPLELAAVAAAARFWLLQNRVTEIGHAAARLAPVTGDPEHHLSLEKSATEAMLDPRTWPEAIRRLQDALTRYGSKEPTWWTAQVSISLVLLGGLDESTVAPITEHLDSPVLSARFTFARAVPFYTQNDFATAAELARQAAVRARTAGATCELAATLMGSGGWSARLASATTADVFDPLAESLELWDRLRVPWGRVAVIEEIAQALAIRGKHEEAVVLWDAADASGIQAPSKIKRPDARSCPSPIATEQTDVGYSRSAAMTLDGAVAFARDTVATVLG
jgi:predicted ATPase/DNA-binding SARP family transcriptional activator